MLWTSEGMRESCYCQHTSTSSISACFSAFQSSKSNEVPKRLTVILAMHRLARYAQFMVRFTVLASGSKGNCTIVTGGNTRILVDAGLSCRELFRRMRLVDEDPATLDAIIITHEHSDHVAGLAVTARKLGIPVYFTEGTHRAWVRWLSPRKQMTYAQWVEQCRQQAAARMAEADAALVEECDPEDTEPSAEPVPRRHPQARACEGWPRKRPHMAAFAPVFRIRQDASNWRYLRQPFHHSPRRGGPRRLRVSG